MMVVTCKELRKRMRPRLRYPGMTGRQYHATYMYDPLSFVGTTEIGGSHEAEITQPRAQLLANPCIQSMG